MTRQVYELDQRLGAARHITSLEPMRRRTPRPLGALALEAFKRGSRVAPCSPWTGEYMR
jgi:hypothetical protein